MRDGFRTASRLLGLAVLVAALTLPLAGCEIIADIVGGDQQEIDDYERIMGKRDPEELSDDDRARMAETDFTVAEGEILAVRLKYGGALANESAWYRVRIDNPRNGWYDYVEYSSEEGLGGDQMGNSHDYRFDAENFNRQLTSEHYDPKDAEGEYQMTVSNSQGWSMTRKLTVMSGRIRGSNRWVFEVP